MTEREELKPCPFCGGEAEVDWSFDTWVDEQKGFWVQCQTENCISLGYSKFHYCERGQFTSEAEATAAWNRRAEG